jgi:ankyrin repeat protein
MRKPRPFLAAAILILTAGFLLSTSADAQGSVSYKFLEVTDSFGKPVADAQVKSLGCSVAKNTDQKGQLEGGVPICYGDDNTSDLTVSKPGYYSFENWGLFEAPFKDRQNEFRIELLKIPQTGAERRAIGNEQLKREFFIAARTADAAAVRRFIKSGLSPNLTTADLRGFPSSENIPLIMFAVSSGDGETVDEFLSAGVNLRRKDDPIRSILVAYLSAYPFTRHYPRTESEQEKQMRGYENTVANLIRSGAELNPAALIIAAERGYTGIVKLLIDKGISVNARDGSGGTALMHVINGISDSKAAIAMADFLLKAGADINVLTPESSDYYYGCKTALIFAVRRGDPEMIRFLLANKADVNLACQNGETALKYARENKSFAREEVIREIIELLEAAGAKSGL